MKKLAKKGIRPGFGWMPDLPDNRDHLYAAPMAKLGPLPAKVDLRKRCRRFTTREKSALAPLMRSRRPSSSIGIKSVGKQGACPESEWRYDDTPADPNTNVWPAGAKPAQKPPKSCYTDAKKFRAVNYQRVDRTLSQMKGCLADGFPFVFGFTVYESFESAEIAQTSVLQMPAPREGVVGGHGVLRLATTTRPSVSWCAVRGAQAGAKLNRWRWRYNNGRIIVTK